MAGEAGAAVLQVLVQNLIDLSKNEISLIRGLKKEAQKLTTNLHTIQQFLNDAETKTITSGDVKSWLQSLENAAFEADNVLDELHYRAALPKELNTNINEEKVPKCCFNYARNRKIAVSIQEINKDLKSIREMATGFGLQKKLADAPTVPYVGMETDAFSADPIFIGRDEAVSEIVETLITSVATHDERVFSILPIVGMGGMGKTTLTRNVFHHQKMEAQFGSRIWVHVSQVFDPINLFNKILEAFPQSQSGEGGSRQGILSKLKNALKDKTYLLVLDDAWNQDVPKWDDFLGSLLGVTSTKGNGIIVTTRNTEVASIVRTLPDHRLNGLSPDDCWSIIRTKTFGQEDVPLNLEPVGKEIAERCGGLPLAASVVGGVLRCDTSVDNWVSIRDNWLPEGEGEGEYNITKILRLSFDNLSSPSLKKCFAYCSIFPKGEKMVKEELIEMWMAEGFLGRDEMESVGDKFYNVLLHSSLLQVAKRKEYGRFRERCVMHDLVHDLASSVLGYSNNADGIIRVRYLFHKVGESSPIAEEVAQHLRTLILEDYYDDTIFPGFKCLHALILKRGSVPIESIRKLIHLRSLNISETYISNLPDWIGELHHLQTLRAERLEKLPSTIEYLIKLRHLHVHANAELSGEIRGLTSLQTLSPFTVRDETKIEVLGSLNNLKGSLTIKCLEKVNDKEEAEKANLFKKSKLSKLSLRWSTYGREEVERNDENVLEGLQPHSNLKKLKIEGFNGKRFPEWTLKMAVRNGPQGGWVGLNQLVEISLKYCEECEEIPMLGHLPNLKSLKIENLKNVKSIRSSFNGIGNETSIVFPVLETLRLSNMPSLKEWAEVESGSKSEVKVFPHLRSLKISNCNQLTTDSYLRLLNKLTLLTYLVLEGLKRLQSLPDELFYKNPNLSYLNIVNCPKLRELPNGLQSLKFLKKLRIKKGGNDLPYEMVESSAPVLEWVMLNNNT